MFRLSAAAMAAGKKSIAVTTPKKDVPLPSVPVDAPSQPPVDNMVTVCVLVL